MGDATAITPKAEKHLPSQYNLIATLPWISKVHKNYRTMFKMKLKVMQNQNLLI